MHPITASAPTATSSTRTRLLWGCAILGAFCYAKAGEAVALPGPASCRFVTAEFSGNRAIASAALRAVARPFVHGCLSEEQIEQLRALLEHAYTDRGYVTSTVVLDPSGDPAVLHFRIIEGRVNAVRAKGLGRLRLAYVATRLRRGPQEALNAKVLRERFKRLLEDPLFSRFSAKLVQGDQADEVDIEVETERSKPYALSVAINNYRPPAIGERGYDLAGLVRNLTGWGDQVDLDLNGPLNHPGTLSYSAGWQLPLNRLDTVLALRSSYSESVVSIEPLASIDFQSQVSREELRLAQPIWRARGYQASLSASLAYEREAILSSSDVPAEFEGLGRNVDHAWTLRLMPDIGYRSDRLELDAHLTLLRANLFDRSSNLTPADQPDSHYWVSNAQLHAVWDLSNAPFEVEWRNSAQWTGARISDLHALSPGGHDTVRGFREAELLLANGRMLNLDVRWLAIPHASVVRPGLSVGPFFDWADGYDVGQQRTTLSSTGLALRARWTHVQFDLAAGLHLIHPGFVDQERGSWQVHGLLVQLAAAL